MPPSAPSPRPARPSTGRLRLFVIALALALGLGVLAPAAPAQAAYTVVPTAGFAPGQVFQVGVPVEAYQAGPEFWSPTPTSVTYQWYFVQPSNVTDAIDGAIGPTYTPTSGQGRLRYEATATGPEGTRTVQFTSPTNVVPGQLQVSGTVVLDAAPDPVPGTSLVIDATGLVTAPSDVNRFYTFQTRPAGSTDPAAWQTVRPFSSGDRSYAIPTSARGMEIRGYLLITRGAYASVQLFTEPVVVPQAGYTTVPTAGFAPGQVFQVGVPVEAYQAGPAFWSPTPDSVTYQWFSGVNTTIDGATGPSYTPTVAGSSLGYLATATGPGGTETVRFTSPTTVALGEFETSGDPLLTSGGVDPVPGRFLIVELDDLSSVPTSTNFLSVFQRRPAGSTDPAAWQQHRTGPNYAITEADVGFEFRGGIQLIRPTYRSTAVWAPNTITVVAPGYTTVPTAGFAPGQQFKVGVPVEAYQAGPTHWSPTPDAVTYQWFSVDSDGNATEIPGATGASYTPTGTGSRLRYEATAIGPGGTRTVTFTSADSVALGQFAVTGQPVLRGSSRVPGTNAIIDEDAVASTPVSTSRVRYFERRLSPTDPWVRVSEGSSLYQFTTDDIGYEFRGVVGLNRIGYETAEVATATVVVEDGEFDITGTPSLTVQGGGAAQPGRTLVADVGTMTSDPEPTQVSYNFVRRLVGDESLGAWQNVASDVTTFMLRPADVGYEFAAIRSVLRSGYTTRSARSAGLVVAPLQWTTTRTPQIFGDPAIGSTLRAINAAPGTWSPVADAVDYRWQRSPDGNTWTDISGPAGAADQYVVTAADAGQRLRVRATGSKLGYETVTTTSATATVPNVFTVEAEPTVAGTVAIGDTVFVGGTGWTPTATTRTQEWQVRDTPTDTWSTLVGQTGSSLVLTRGLVRAGGEVRVIVTGKRSGYTDSVRTSPAVTVAPGTQRRVEALTFFGDAVVGGQLVGDGGTFPASITPDGAQQAFQWQRKLPADSTWTDIPSATRITYEIPPADDGYQLRLQSVATQPDYLPLTTTSSPTAAVGADTFSPPTLTVTGDAAVNETLVVTGFGPGAWGPTDPTAVTFLWQGSTDGNDWSDLSVAAFYNLQAADVGKLLRVRVTGSRDGYETLTVTSDPIGPVAPAAFTTVPTPQVRGAAQVGRTLTVSDADTGLWDPIAESVDYVWQVRVGNGPWSQAATGPLYTVRLEDVGREIRVVATGRLPGYVATETASDPVGSVPPVAFSGVPTPVVSGTAQVGETLTVTGAGAASWSPEADSVGYVWQTRAAGSGGGWSDVGTGDTFVLRPVDLGRDVRVVATATKAAYATTDSPSLPRGPVTPAVFSATPTPVVVGVLRVGDTVTVSGAGVGEWTPVADSVSYQWQVRAGGDWVPVTSGETFELRVEHAGADIRVVATASKAGYATTDRVSSVLGPIASAAFVTVPTPVVSGSLTVGETLTATGAGADQWSPVADSVAYEWRVRDGSGPWAAVGTGSTFVLRPVDAGRDVQVRATATLAGYAATASDSLARGPVATAGFSTVPTVVVSGTLTVGETLTATGAGAGQWSPVADAVSYVWQTRSGSGAWSDAGTGVSFVLRSEDVGREVRVVATAVKAGYASADATSAARGPVATADFTGVATPVVSGALTVGQTLTATGAGVAQWSPVADSVFYVWQTRTGSDAWSDAGTGVSFVLRPQDAGREVRVVATAVKAGYASADATSAARGPVGLAGFTTVATPVVSGALTVGETLIATGAGVAAWSPVADSVSYVWQTRSGAGAWSDAGTGVSFVVRPLDAGRDVRVVVTAVKAGYSSADATSAARGPVGLAGFTTVATPVVSGTLAVGETLTATGAGADDWSPSADVVGQVWQVRTGSGPWVDAGTGATFVVRPVDVGREVRVVATAVRDGYAGSASASSPRGPVVAAPFTTVATPVVSGTLMVGETLTATGAGVAQWSPVADAVSYVWQTRAGAGAWSDADTGVSFVLRPEDAGRDVRVVVTATKAGYSSADATSDSRGPVGTAAFVTAPTPVVSGTLTVGETLTATGAGVAQWSPVADAVSYVWQTRAGSGAWSDAGAGASFVLRPQDAGRDVRVVATAVKAGYSSTDATSAARGPVGTAGFTGVATPVVSGTLTVGETLTATGAGASAWSPVADSVSYVWQTRAGSGAWSDAGTGSTFVLRPQDAGRDVRVVATAMKAGYASTDAASAARGPVAPADFDAVPTPEIAGILRVGETLTASGAAAAQWSPVADSVSYVWQARTGSGTWSDVASDVSFTPGPSLVGADLRVVVRATKAGYTSTDTLTAVRGPVATAEFTATPTLVVSGTVQVGETLTATGAGPEQWAPFADSVSYVWQTRAGNGAWAEAGSGVTFALRPTDAGSDVRVLATATRAGYTPTDAVSVSRGPVAAAPFDVAPVVQVSGVPQVGQTLTVTGAAEDQWSPRPDDVTYRWQTRVDDGPWADVGDDSPSYAVVPGDLGHELRVVVKASALGYVDREVTAEAGAVGPGDLGPLPITVTGRPESGSVLRAAVGLPDVAGVTVTWRWLRDGVLLRVQGESLPLRRSFSGGRIAARATVRAPGYGTVVVTTRQSEEVTPVHDGELGVRLARRTVRAGARVVVRVAGLVPQRSYLVLVPGVPRLARFRSDDAGMGRAVLRAPRRASVGSVPVTVREQNTGHEGRAWLQVLRPRR